MLHLNDLTRLYILFPHRLFSDNTQEGMDLITKRPPFQYSFVLAANLPLLSV